MYYIYIYIYYDDGDDYQKPIMTISEAILFLFGVRHKSTSHFMQ